MDGNDISHRYYSNGVRSQRKRKSASVCVWNGVLRKCLSMFARDPMRWNASVSTATATTATMATPTTIIDACFAGYETNIATWFLWCTTHLACMWFLISYTNRCSDAQSPLTTERIPNGFCFVYTSAYGRRSDALSSSRFAHTFAFQAIQFHPSLLHIHRYRVACVSLADETDGNAAVKPSAKLNEGWFWTIAINPQCSVWFRASFSECREICIGWYARVPNTQSNNSVRCIDRFRLNSIRFKVNEIENSHTFQLLFRWRASEINLMTHLFIPFFSWKLFFFCSQISGT